MQLRSADAERRHHRQGSGQRDLDYRWQQPESLPSPRPKQSLHDDWLLGLFARWQQSAAHRRSMYGGDAGCQDRRQDYCRLPDHYRLKSDRSRSLPSDSSPPQPTASDDPHIVSHQPGQIRPGQDMSAHSSSVEAPNVERFLDVNYLDSVLQSRAFGTPRLLAGRALSCSGVSTNRRQLQRLLAALGGGTTAR